MPLHLIVHDYDAADLRARVLDLRAVMADARIESEATRARLLRRIASLPPDGVDGRWPLLLVDLQATAGDRNVRGEHLLRTIHAHPGLRGRAVVVAFTRYGHETRDRAWEAIGVRAVLHPTALRDATRYRIERRLNLLAAGADGFERLGSPPSVDDERLVDAVAAYFPNVAESDDEQERLAKTRRVLTICRLAADDFDDDEIIGRVQATRRELADLRDQMRGSRQGRALAAKRPGARHPSLGDVAEQLLGGSSETSVIWDVRSDRDWLSADRISRAAEELASREPIEHDTAVWMPPDAIAPLRHFVGTYGDIAAAANRRRQFPVEEFGGPHPSFEQLMKRREVALASTAERFSVDVEALEARIVHAITCLEEALTDDLAEGGLVIDDRDASTDRPNRSPDVGPVSVFYAYSHRDAPFRDRLETHLAVLRRQGLIEDWYDRQIRPGQVVAREIDDRLRTADVILLLVSADFLASDYCYEVEMKLALERHERGDARVIPLILRDVDWHRAPFAHLLALPTDGKPVVAFRNRDRAWLQIVAGIRNEVSGLRQERA
jgi:hypothetical protein